MTPLTEKLEEKIIIQRFVYNPKSKAGASAVPMTSTSSSDILAVQSIVSSSKIAHISSSKNSNDIRSINNNTSDSNHDSSSGTTKPIMDMATSPDSAAASREVPPDISEAQNSFICPPGYRMFRVPPITGSRSNMYDYGVRVEEMIDCDPSQLHQPTTVPGTSRLPWGKKRRVPGRFYCMADARCRERQTIVKISNKCTSSASDHLRIIHGITSEKGTPRGRSTQAQKKKKLRPEGSPSVTPSNELGDRDRKPLWSSTERVLAEGDRYISLSYIKSHTILGLEPLEYLENDHRREFLRLVTGVKRTSFSVDSLDSRGIKRGLLEMYHARNTLVRKALEREKRTTSIRFINLSVSRWRSGPGGPRRGEEYVGVRAHFMTQEFRLESHLLGVRRFFPVEEVSSEKAGTLVTLWVGHVLEEYGLEWSSVAGVTIDGGGGARAGFDFAVCRGIPGVLLERCIPSGLDLAMREAFGLEGGARGGVENKAARDVLEGVKKAVESLDVPEMTQGLGEPSNRAPTAERLWQPLSHRWERSVDTLERFLTNYSALASSSFPAETVDGQMGSVRKAELQEIYSLIKSLSVVVQTCFSVSEPATPTAMLRLIMLLSSDLDATRPLELHDPSEYLPPPASPMMENGAGRCSLTDRLSSPHPGLSTPANASAASTAAVAAVTAAAALDAAAAPTKKPPARVSKRSSELTAVGRSTREKTRDAVYRALGLRRWGEKHGEESHLFDMILALHPGCRQLGYVDKLSSPGLVSGIKTKVYAQIMRLVEAVIEFERAEMAKALPDPCVSGGSGSGSGSSGDSGVGREGGTPGHSHRKRPRVSPASPFDDDPADGDVLDEDDPMASAGVFDAVAEGRAEEDERIGAAEEAAAAVEAWCAAKLPAHFRTIRTGEGLADFWRTYGSKNFRLLSVVARSVLAVPCSAAVLKRDVDDCGGLATDRQRRLGESALDRGYGEMATLLCAAFDSIPADVPRLSREAAEEAIPRRFRDPKMLQELIGMSCDAVVSERGCRFSLFGLEEDGRPENGSP